jgi:hypothetical protein
LRRLCQRISEIWELFPRMLSWHAVSEQMFSSTLLPSNCSTKHKKLLRNILV